jgi:hypothetical protein
MIGFQGGSSPFGNDRLQQRPGRVVIPLITQPRCAGVLAADAVREQLPDEGGGEEGGGAFDQVGS